MSYFRHVQSLVSYGTCVGFLWQLFFLSEEGVIRKFKARFYAFLCIFELNLINFNYRINHFFQIILDFYFGSFSEKLAHRWF